MLYINHPLESEYYDPSSFVDENIHILRVLYDNVLGREPSLTDGEAATIMAVCVYANQTEFEPPVKYSSQHEDGIGELSQNLIVVLNIFKLEDSGMVKLHHDGSVSLTERGALHAKAMLETKQEDSNEL